MGPRTITLLVLVGALLVGASGPPTVQAQGAPRITVTSGNVSCSWSITVYGEGFEPGSQVIVSPGGPEDVPATLFDAYFGPVNVAADGTFSIEFGVAGWVYACFGGPLGRDGAGYSVTASTINDPESDNPFGPPLASAAFTFALDPNDPSLTLMPDYGSGCLEVVARGVNFEPGTVVTIFVGQLGGHVFGPALDEPPWSTTMVASARR